MQTLAHNLAHSERSKSMYRLPFRWTGGSTGVTNTFIVSNKATKEQVHGQVHWKKNIRNIDGFSEKPRDRSVGEALIKHQIEIAS